MFSFPTFYFVPGWRGEETHFAEENDLVIAVKPRKKHFQCKRWKKSPNRLSCCVQHFLLITDYTHLYLMGTNIKKFLSLLQLKVSGHMKLQLLPVAG